MRASYFARIALLWTFRGARAPPALAAAAPAPSAFFESHPPRFLPIPQKEEEAEPEPGEGAETPASGWLPGEGGRADGPGGCCCGIAGDGCGGGGGGCGSCGCGSGCGRPARLGPVASLPGSALWN